MAYTKITNFTSKDATNEIIVGAEIDDEFDAISTAIALNDAHIVDATAAHAASAISYAGGTGMSATDVEAAIDELATEKANLSGGTFTGDIIVPAEAYAVGWNGSNEAPTKNDVYDKIESIIDGQAFTGAITVPDDAYAVGWNGSTEVPTKNAVYDKIESLGSGTGVRLLKYTAITATDATWAKQAGTTAIEVLCVGGGGAGGGCTTTADTFGDGGQAGEQVRGYLDTGLTSTFVATIGTGGTGVSAAGGNDGNTTSFTTSTPTTIASALGGYGGEMLGVATSNIGAINGHSGVKRGGKNGLGLAGSAAAANSGAGGGGSASTGSNLAGGAGGSGIIYVWEYG